MARGRTLRNPFDEAGTRARRDKRQDYMHENWWPDLLAHVPEECPWAASDVVVAEMRGFDDPSVPGVRFMWSALVPVAELEALGGRLRAFGHEVESSGRPSPLLNGPQSFNPRFWIGTYLEGEDGAPSVREDYEPLILGWTSNNQTAMVLDPRFAMTYGLMPRVHVDGSTRWDNPAEPEFDVASVDKPSLYADLRYEDMRAIVSRDYLQDYLSLRDMALVQVFYECRHGPSDKTAELALGTSHQLNEHLLTREIDVQRRRDGSFCAQVWGARHVAGPGDFPISVNPLETQGLVWPGNPTPVTSRIADRFRPRDYIYVRDTVLGAYEGRPGFHVHPESGGVGYQNQWNVGPAGRIGRDLIQLEIRKLYGGTPHRVVQHWHGYAVAATAEQLSAEARKVPNVGTRAKALTYGIADVGERLSALAARFGIEVSGEEFVKLDRTWLHYHGWWQGLHVEPVARHIPLDMTRSAFLARCLDLDKLVVECLAERHLRLFVRAFGPQADKIDKLRGLKLLDRTICFCQIGHEAGLSVWDSAEEIVSRFEAAGTAVGRPIEKLFALSDLRQVTGHRKEDMDGLIAGALERFGLDLAAARGGWGHVMDTIYDQLADQLATVVRLLDDCLSEG